MQDRPAAGSRVAAGLAAGLPLAAYLLTLCPTVYVGDSGEMVALAHTLGVAQPTGFPLYCLLGKIATLFPFGSYAARVNALSALSLTVAGLAIYRLLARLTRPGLALLASLTFTLGQTAWSQATIARTYPLTLALTAVELDLALLCAARPGQLKFLGLALLSGFGLGTHLLAVLIGPVMAWLWFREPLPRKAAALALVAVGLSLYAYLPIRAAVTPYNAYGPLDTPGQLADYLRQKRYAGKQFSRSDANLRAFARILGHRILTDQPFFLVLAPVALLGLLDAARRHRVLLAFLAVPVAANLFILLGYGDDTDLPFLPRYFLVLFMAQAILFGLGLERLAARAPARPLFVCAALLVAFGAWTNARLADRSGTVFPRDYAAALIEPLPAGSLLFLAGDASTLMIDYLQYVELRRRDVRCGEPDTYQEHIAPIYASGKMPPTPVFANFLPAGLPASMRAVHTGLVWQILPAGTAPVLDRDRFWRERRFPGLTTDPALCDYESAAVAGEVLLHRGLDELESGRPEAARDAFETATRVSPENRLLFYNLARIYAKAGWTTEASAHLERALALDVTARGSGPGYRLERYRERGLSPAAK